MLQSVWNRKKSFNNNSKIADSNVFTYAKYFYYKFIIYLYGIMGKYVDYPITNSTWTNNHIKSIWK